MGAGAETLAYPPRLLPVDEAARYLGVSPSTMRSLNIPRRCLGAKRLYDLRDLSAYADALPYDREERNSCDEVFG